MSEQELEKAKNQAYRERDMLLAALARWVYEVMREDVFEVYRTTHPAEDQDWEADWRNIIVIESHPYGVKPSQMTWHVHDSEMPMFAYLPVRENTWDGHDTRTKYNRLLELALVPLPYIVDLTRGL